jgi:hypothetical protein
MVDLLDIQGEIPREFTDYALESKGRQEKAKNLPASAFPGRFVSKG